MTAGFMHGSVGFFIISIVSALIVALVDTISPKIISVTVDSVLDTKAPELPEFIISAVNSLGGFEFFRTHLYYIALLIVALAVITAIFQYCNRVFNAKGAETLVKNMRDSIFSHIERLPFSWHMKNQTGDIIQRCTSDVDTIKRFLSDQLYRLASFDGFQLSFLGSSSFSGFSLHRLLGNQINRFRFKFQVYTIHF